MGFREVQQRVIACLEQGAYLHEIRSQIEVKNLFQCGQLTSNEVIALIQRTRGNQYQVSPHHQVPSVDVHVLKPVAYGRAWYIKFYFVEPDVVFISVH